MPIPFTQYLRPDGRKKPVTISRPAEIEQMANDIINAGYWFECEELVNGVVSFTITDDDDDHAAEVCHNGPNVPDVVDRMISEFHIKLGKKHGNVVA
jgi:hypothetical protein